MNPQIYEHCLSGGCHPSAPFFVIRVAPMMSFQRVTLESSSYCTFTWCRVKFPRSQCLGTGMTPS
ncbi:hypothetical protein [Wolbachia endosymbiont (group A) of Agelastica alni]|uniref:hypothetical protein n=1 Tax=Wolbachia endosymbiont (group A) of Agelastica alni TaxID=3066130 RepID=UPI003132C41D